jgi:ATP-dependent exoDNAse (exonuclease V) beta subunit
MSNEQKSHSPIEAIRQWYRGLTRSQSALAECGAEGFERMAHDIGVSSTELYRLASRGPESANLLCQRMEALDLDQDEVARVERATFQDLQRVCSMCDCKKRCARDLARHPANPIWEDYCPNAQTLTALNALPWTARREW